MNKSDKKRDYKKKMSSKRTSQLNVDSLYNGIRRGNKSDLAQAITLVESSKSEHFEMANALMNKLGSSNKTSYRIGVTGVPGVGKSTFIEALGKYLTKLDKKVAVLAVDPSSSLTKGSILGDKTRMQTLSTDPDAFIRPSPAGNSLGGVSRKTRETILLCEAAGYDIILIETVGVGQSETLVHSMVDFFLLLKIAGAGDELQGIKRGIMEMADAIVINKADGNNLKASEQAKTEFSRALHLYPAKENGWLPKVLLASSIEKKGLDKVWQLIQSYFEMVEKNGFLKNNRIAQAKNWFLQSLENELKTQFMKNDSIKTDVEMALSQIEKNQISPFFAAKSLVEKFLK